MGQTLFVLLGGVGALFLALPLVGLLLRALRQNAWQALSADAVMTAIQLSAITTLSSVSFTLIFGTPLAYLLARGKFPFKRLVNVIVELPIVLPPAVAGLALLSVFGRRGIFSHTLDSLNLTIAFTGVAVVIAQTFVAAPFFIRAASVGFASIPREIEDAARVDGASEAALFWFITLPLAGRSLGAGLVLSWARAMGEFGATIMFAGSLQGITQTMPLFIYETFNRDVDAAIAAGLILVGVALVALMLSAWLRPHEDAQ
ncbi:MAG: Molybdenum transport system permease protein ModB [Chloroflexi bacterium AL-W]|nr:Molybdenum transport system permease protein ModB [Chloroflexi bacterium AL-W]